MASAATTIKLFGVYVIMTGLTLLLTPNLLLALFGTPEAKEIWIRVLGALAIVVGYYYYWACAVGNARAFFAASVCMATNSGRVKCASPAGLNTTAFASSETAVNASPIAVARGPPPILRNWAALVPIFLFAAKRGDANTIALSAIEVRRAISRRIIT